MIQIVYESEATARFREEDLVDIIESARTSNPALEVTGLLIYHDRRFVQVIEGPEDRVTRLYEHIEADPRHTDVWRLARLEIEERVFSRWSMGLITKENMPDHLIGSLRDFREVSSRLKQAGKSNPECDAAYAARLVRRFLDQCGESA
jgi:hypothetical protein